jgi:hypothetical protein
MPTVSIPKYSQIEIFGMQIPIPSGNPELLLHVAGFS